MPVNDARDGAEGMPGPLQGLRVVEVAEGIAGPYCGKLLADMGAEVLKVERPRQGDRERYSGPFYHDEPSADSGLLFNFLNTSKLGITLDVATATGRGLLGRLVAEADVLLVSGRPSEIEARGVGFDVWSAKQPLLVATYVTPFGLQGPHADWQGGELVAFHLSALGLATPRDRLRRPGQRPLKGGGNQALMAAGLTAAVATMHALYARDASGRGQKVDVSEVEPLTSFQFLNLARWAYQGDAGDAGYGEGSRRIWARDGAVSMLLFTGQDRQWDAFKELLGNPDWLEGYQPPVSRIPPSDPFWAHLNEWSGQYTKEELYRKAQGLRIPLFPQNTVAEAVESDQVQSRGFIQEMPLATGGTVRAPAAPSAFSKTPARPRGPAPTLGRDNSAVFCGRLGLSEQELLHAYEAGVI